VKKSKGKRVIKSEGRGRIKSKIRSGIEVEEEG
jgi:hypothetical protein